MDGWTFLQRAVARSALPQGSRALIPVKRRPGAIENNELKIVNEPAGLIEFQPKGYLRPKATLAVVFASEAALAEKVTLVARQPCNIYGLWDEILDIAVT
jgi:desulfoferrodoxin (superoxide reductase-like protein)